MLSHADRVILDAQAYIGRVPFGQEGHAAELAKALRAIGPTRRALYPLKESLLSDGDEISEHTRELAGDLVDVLVEDLDTILTVAGPALEKALAELLKKGEKR